MSVASHLVQADSIATLPSPSSKPTGNWDERASRKAPPPPPPALPPKPVQGPLFENEELDEVEWERIRTLPTVRLIPSEEG